jgi:hypothetical protein
MFVRAWQQSSSHVAFYPAIKADRSAPPPALTMGIKRPF